MMARTMQGRFEKQKHQGLPRVLDVIEARSYVVIGNG